MATITGLTIDKLKAKIKELKDRGKTESTSKELGKYIDALKALTPDRYGAETVASAKLKLASSTQPQSTGLSGESGGSGLGFSGSGSSVGIDLNSMYDNLMNSPEIQQLRKELEDKRRAKDEANANINDNPWYSEATRVGKISKLNEKADREISTLEQALAERKADAQVKIGMATQQYNIETQAYQQNLNKLNMLINSGALMNASGNDIAQIAVATGISTPMIKGIITKMKSDAIKPQLFTDAQTGKVTAIDPSTGKVLYSTQVSTPKVDTSDSVQERAFDAAIAAGIEQLKSGEHWGTVFERIKSKFRGYIPENVLNQLIDQGLGVYWRQPSAYENWKARTEKNSGQTINIINPGSN